MSSAKVSRTKKEVDSKVLKEEVKPEPVVETKPDVVEDGEDEDSKKVPFDELMIEMIETYKGLCTSVTAFKQQLVALKKAHNQAMRQQSSRKTKRKVVVDSGILKPVPLPVEAEAFLKDVGVAIPESNLMRRTELSAAIYQYVKSKTLYKADPSKESGFDRKVIIPDAKLRKLFSLTADQILDFSLINVNLAKIYKNAKSVEESATVPVQTKAVAPTPAPAKKGKVAGSSA